MRFVECAQGTELWLSSRSGKITASCFADAISTVGGLDERQAQYVRAVRAGATEKDAAAAAGYKALPTSDYVRRALAGESTEEPSDTARRYAADLAIERISGQPHGEPPKAWVLERGHEMEAHARRIYEGRTGAFVTEAGICITDDELFGYSSDGLVDDDGLIEIKAPIDSIKILHVLETGDTAEYDHQIQGGMWITGRKWCDFIMYVPDLAAVGRDLYIKRVFRDDAFIDAMVARLCEFDKLVVAYQAALRGPQDDVVDAEFDPDFQEVTAAPAIELAATQTSPEGAELSPAAQALNEQQGATRFAAAHPKPASTMGVATAPVLRPADAWPAPVTPPTLRLGQINERIAPLAISADGLRTLGFEPAGRDKAAVLYHDRDFGMICAALNRHISAVQAKQAA